MGTSRNNPGTNSFENRHSEMTRIATWHFEMLKCNFWFHQMTCGKDKHATSLKTSSLGPGTPVYQMGMMSLGPWQQARGKKQLCPALHSHLLTYLYHTLPTPRQRTEPSAAGPSTPPGSECTVVEGPAQHTAEMCWLLRATVLLMAPRAWLYGFPAQQGSVTR